MGPGNFGLNLGDVRDCSEKGGVRGGRTYILHTADCIAFKFLVVELVDCDFQVRASLELDEAIGKPSAKCTWYECERE